MLNIPAAHASTGKQRVLTEWHDSCSHKKWLALCILQERLEEVLMEGVTDKSENMTWILRSRSSWLAWVSGQFWLLSSIRHKEASQRKSMVGARQGCDHEGKHRNE